MSNLNSAGPGIRKLTKAEMDTFTRARAMAYSKAPWVAGALFTLKPVYVEGFGTWAVDEHGRVYVSNEGWASTWTEEERAYVLIHEVWHWLRRHPQRTKDALTAHPEWSSVWAKAVDMEINDDIASMPGAKLPDRCVYPHTHDLPEEWTAEQYASALAQKDEDQSGGQGGDQGDPQDGSQQSDGSGQSGQSQGSDNQPDQGGQDGQQPGDGSGSGQGGQPDQGEQHPGPGAGGNNMGECARVPESWKEAADKVEERISEGMREFAEKKVAEAVKEAAEKSRGVGRGDLQWAEDKLAPPKIDWRRKLRVSLAGQVIAVKGNARDSYNQPNRRNDSRSFILPGRRAVDPNVLVGIDKSGSMFDGSLTRALNETTGVLKSRGIRSIRIMTVDSIASDIITKRGRKLGAIDGAGGGTDMREAYRAIAELSAGKRPTNFILLTDGETPWPAETERIHGVYCLAGIITRSESRYDQLIADLPSWITPVYIPLTDEDADRAA